MITRHLWRPFTWVGFGLVIAVVPGCGGGSGAGRDATGGAGGAPAVDATVDDRDLDVAADQASDLAMDLAMELASEAPSGDGGVDDGLVPDAAPADAAPDSISRPDSLIFDGTIDGEQLTCNTLPNTAPLIEPKVRGAATTPPVLRGGTIADGRYELVAVDVYSDRILRAAVPSVFRRTVEFHGADFQLVELSRTDVSETEWTTVRRSYAVTIAADGALTAVSDACAGTGGASTEYRYEATADTIVMYFANTQLLLSYLRAP